MMIGWGSKLAVRTVLLRGEGRERERERERQREREREREGRERGRERDVRVVTSVVVHRPGPLVVVLVPVEPQINALVKKELFPAELPTPAISDRRHRGRIAVVVARAVD